jgi:uncharacterized membrane protein
MHDVTNPLYLPLRFLHILGAMLFLGGLVAALAWKLLADRSNDPAFAARAHRTMRKLDGIWIGPSALLTFAAGYAMIRFLGGKILQHAFVLWGLVLLFASLGLWFFGMRHAGAKLAEEAEACEANKQPLTRAYATKSAQFVLSALLSILLVVVTAILMVFRLPSG